MPRTESTQKKLGRIRAPRVHITYDVEVGDAIEMKELPFVLGVLGDFSGKPEEQLPRMKDRKMIEIDRDNFDKVLAGMKPRVAFNSENKMDDRGGKIGVDLRFSSMEDFEPDQVVQQVEPLRKLVAVRRKLSDLVSNMDGNDKLEQMLGDILKDTGAQQQLSAELGIQGSANGGEKKESDNE